LDADRGFLTVDRVGCAVSRINAEGAMDAMRLGAVSGPHTGRILEVGDQLTMGRSPDCSLVLPDPKVSRQHTTVWRESGVLMVRDEDSMNGTWLNGARIKMPMSLMLGDRVRVGSSEFVVCDESETFDGDRPREAAITDPGERTVLHVGASP
jgi:pSer/pThr/pTyr-binding forkhead associated (FHA) protein